MEQDRIRRRAFWLLAGIFAAAACTAALVLMFTGREGRREFTSPETAKAETAEDSYGRAGGNDCGEREEASRTGDSEKPETEEGMTSGSELPAGISGDQVKAREEGYCLVSENGFLFVFAKDRSSVCLDTHMPLSEFPLTEQERLLDGLWFSSMLEVLNYLESYTS